MANTMQVQQRFPINLLRNIDTWANESHMNRTAAVNHICQTFFDNLELARLRSENNDLRTKIVQVTMAARPQKSYSTFPPNATMARRQVIEHGL